MLEHRVRFELTFPIWQTSVLNRTRRTMLEDWSEWKEFNFLHEFPKPGCRNITPHSVIEIGLDGKSRTCVNLFPGQVDSLYPTSRKLVRQVRLELTESLV